ncbi:MAG: CPBP family glutamic-type intramembrane protease [Candidatus Bathyarchaeota archaeon]|nr:CPBP family glutamic-type intramembrane protease [Candidatus Bathyarchaeota archaeon]MDH5712608.1 CPBP family glutamic-type intramembrane protease [Candidatus Bathyarchaeota archaeon]
MVAQNEVKLDIKIFLAAALIITVLFLVFSYLLSIPLGLVLFFFTPEGSAFSTGHLLALPVELFMTLYFFVPVTINVGLAFLFLLGVYALCFAGAWISRESLHDMVRKGLSRPFTKFFNNNLFAMPIITSMLLTAVITISSFQESVGIPTGSPPEWESRFETFFIGGTLLALVEEIGFRISTIGVFLIAYLFLVKRKTVASWSVGHALKVAFLIPLFPDKAKKSLGVKTVSEFGIRGISLAEWIMIIITSSVFGWVHVGHPWGLGKFTTATLVGLAFGLAYLLYGAQAPILLHWFFNYYGSAYGLALDFYPTVSPIVFLINLVTLTLGVVGWSTFIVLLGVWVYRRRKRIVTPLAVPPSPQTLPPSNSKIFVANAVECCPTT